MRCECPLADNVRRSFDCIFTKFNFLLLQFVFCRDCLQGYHIGECITDDVTNANSTSYRYDIDPTVSIAKDKDDAGTKYVLEAAVAPIQR